MRVHRDNQIHQPSPIQPINDVATPRAHISHTRNVLGPKVVRREGAAASRTRIQKRSYGYRRCGGGRWVSW